jgi:hypothetical protein
MRKSSTIIGLAIATVLTASALTLSNQAFAQHNSWYNDISSPHGQPGTSTAQHNSWIPDDIAGHEVHCFTCIVTHTGNILHLLQNIINGKVLGQSFPIFPRGPG